MNCPHCKHDLTIPEVKKLWSQLGRSFPSEKRVKAAQENGKKGGRPKGTKYDPHKRNPIRIPIE